MGDYDSIDLDWTWNGDYMVGPDGDIMDTSDDFIRSLTNEIRTIVKSEFNDWEKDPNIGADLADFRGEPNTKTTGQAIQDRIKSKLVTIGLVKPEDLSVRVIPVHINQVMVVIKVLATATPGNSLKLGEPVVVSLVYDSSEHDVFFLPPNLKDRERVSTRSNI